VFDRFWSQSFWALKQALCTPYSEAVMWALVLHTSSRWSPVLSLNTNCIQKPWNPNSFNYKSSISRILLHLSLKSYSKPSPSRFSNGASLERVALPIIFCYMSFESLNKGSPNKKGFHPSLKGPRKGASLMFPKMGLLLKQMPISRSLLGISFVFHSKGALPSGSPLRAPSLKSVVFPEPFLIHFSKSPVYDPPSKFPSGPL